MKSLFKLNAIKMMKRRDFVSLRQIYLNMSNATKVQYKMHRTTLHSRWIIRREQTMRSK